MEQPEDTGCKSEPGRENIKTVWEKRMMKRDSREATGEGLFSLVIGNIGDTHSFY